MALTAPIEVQAGADRPLQLGLWMVWLAALGSGLIHFPQIPLWLAFLIAGVLCWSFPGRHTPALTPQRLLLHADGHVTIAGAQGSWQRNIWRSPWYTVILIKQGDRRWQAWISARNNSADDYRRLGIWSRYSPQQSGELPGNAQLP